MIKSAKTAVLELADSSKSATLLDLCDIFDLSNLVKGPTCYSNKNKPSLLDVILTNKQNEISKTNNFTTGISDFHNMITAKLRTDVPKQSGKWKTCRSFKSFEINAFLNDLQNEDLSLASETNVNVAYENFNEKNYEIQCCE